MSEQHIGLSEHNNLTYFPIEIRYEGSTEKVIINHPVDLLNKSFKVLRIRVKE
jgi:hypothetical protein